MSIVITLMLACFPEIRDGEEERFPENPRHNYDGDPYDDASDCDDSNPDIGLPQWYYKDADGDGFGLQTDSHLWCPDEKEEGYILAVERDGLEVFDCNDDPEVGGASIHPDAREECDGVDNNCSGEIDDAPQGVGLLWHLDADGDGFGDYLQTVRRCNPPPGYVDDDSDCDDSDPLIHIYVQGMDGGVELCDEEMKDENCNGIVNEDSAFGAPIWYQDADEDGYGSNVVLRPSCDQPDGFVVSGGDCDDTNPSVSPDQSELCNEIDDDCNGLVDEGENATAPPNAILFYADSDGDGFGDVNNTSLTCDAPSGFVSNFDDCNDTNASVYPNATEYCNGLDDDCDGSLDEEDAVDKSEWFEDSDGDGFGNGGVIQFACNQPNGYVSVSGDCNDGDGAVSPNSTEVCNSIDDNCDGLMDDADANLDLNTATEFFSDDDVDGQGDPNSSIFRCTIIPGFVSNDTDCDDGNSAIYLGAPEFCNGLDDDCNGVDDDNAEDALDYFEDSDGDGHGLLNGAVVEQRCPSYDPQTSLPIHPSGLSPTSDDCDDADASISPSATELCSNTIDENCDGHNTAGATDVSTFLVDADGDTFGSGERDTNGELAYALDLCIKPYGYVLYDETIHLLDCDDSDAARKPGATELCNGQLDNCSTNSTNTIPADEVDHDGDGWVLCTLDVDPLQWADLSLGIEGGDDCDDADPTAWPGAPELCNGVFEDCSNPLFVYQTQTAPDDELDDDGDCHVECSGFDSTTWEGGVHTCERIDGTGQLIQETVVVGGDDCNDNNPVIYTGAAYLEPLECDQDADYDGMPDCNLVDLVGQTTDYQCDFGVFPPNGGLGPDFVLVQGGVEPLGRYELTHNFYVMTTEATQKMWIDVMDGTGYSYNTNQWYPSIGGIGDMLPAYQITWLDAIAFANRLSVLTGREECYSSNDLHSNFATPYECTGFRLLTDAEWEYAARSGTTSGFWTGQGPQLGGSFSNNSTSGTEQILDGAQNPLIIDYAWYSGNSGNIYGSFGAKDVGQLLPNGFGLYDMHGNEWEWTSDPHGCSYPASAIDPYCSLGSGRVIRGGYWDNSPVLLGASFRGMEDPLGGVHIGIRLALTE